MLYKVWKPLPVKYRVNKNSQMTAIFFLRMGKTTQSCNNVQRRENYYHNWNGFVHENTVKLSFAKPAFLLNLKNGVEYTITLLGVAIYKFNCHWEELSQLWKI